MKIGKYEFTKDCHAKDGEYWIAKPDGEGGIFKIDELFEKLEKVIDEFYKENF